MGRLSAAAPSFARRMVMGENMARQINQEGLELIKRFEGLELEAYQDVAGIWTIGYGHINTARPGMRITEQQAEELLHQDLQRFEEGVERLVKVPLNDNEYSALVSFSFNVGVNALAGSTALRRLNKGDRIGAAEALEWWNKARVNGVLQEVRGLTRRRAAEKALFLKPAAMASPPIPQRKPEIIEDEPPAVAVGGGAAPVPQPKPTPAPAPQNEPAEAPAYDLEEDTRVTGVENPPRRPALGDSRTMQGAGAAGVAGAAGAAGEVAKAIETEAMQESWMKRAVEFFSGLPDWFFYAVFAIIILSVIWIMWARIDDWNRYRR